jgi:hypothetical protein
MHRQRLASDVATSTAPSPKVDWIARFGYAARGVVYLLAGLFSLQASIGQGGQSVGPKGAFGKLLGLPLGGTLVYVLAAGLICFGGWRAFQAVYDPDKFTCGPSSIARRLVVYGGSAIIHLALAATAINVALVARGTDEDRQARDWTAWLLSQPLGQTLIMMIGLGIATGGVALAFQAIRAPFERKISTRGNEKTWIVMLGRVGFLARGVVFVLVGVFLTVAGWQYDAKQATGFAGALRALQNQRYGSPLLGFTAVGLICFGAFELGQAARRRMPAHAPASF